MQAAWVDVHLLNRLSLENILINFVDTRSTPPIAEAVEWCLPYQVTSLGKDPNVPVLHLCELELILRDLHVISRYELEDILDITLVSFETMHIVQRM